MPPPFNARAYRFEFDHVQAVQFNPLAFVHDDANVMEGGKLFSMIEQEDTWRWKNISYIYSYRLIS